MQGRRVFPLALAVALTLASIGCASGGGSAGAAVDESVFREDVGRVVYGPLERAREKMWSKHAIPLYRQENDGHRVLWESDWIQRPAVEGELAAAGRNRVTMSGYEVGVNLDGTNNFRVTFQVENQVRSVEIPEWHPAPFPEEVKDIFKRLYADLMMEVRAGVRR